MTRVQHLQKNVESFNLQHLPRGGNTHADALAMLATSSAQNLPRVIIVEDLGRPSGEKGKMVLRSLCQSRAQLDGPHHSIPQ